MVLVISVIINIYILKGWIYGRGKYLQSNTSLKQQLVITNAYICHYRYSVIENNSFHIASNSVQIGSNNIEFNTIIYC